MPRLPGHILTAPCSDLAGTLRYLSITLFLYTTYFELVLSRSRHDQVQYPNHEHRVPSCRHKMSRGLFEALAEGDYWSVQGISSLHVCVVVHLERWRTSGTAGKLLVLLTYLLELFGSDSGKHLHFGSADVAHACDMQAD